MSEHRPLLAPKGKYGEANINNKSDLAAVAIAVTGLVGILLAIRPVSIWLNSKAHKAAAKNRKDAELESGIEHVLAVEQQRFETNQAFEAITSRINTPKD